MKGGLHAVSMPQAQGWFQGVGRSFGSMRASRLRTSSPSRPMSDSDTIATDASATVDADARLGWRATLAESLRGTRRNLTSIPVGQAIALVAIPTILEMAMESLFAIADIYWIKPLGSTATAVVSITEAMMAILYALAIGLSVGASAVVSRRIGEGDPRRAARAAVLAIAIAIAVAVPISLLGVIFAGDLLRVMGGSEEVVALGRPFTATMLGSSFIIMLLFVINGVFRAAGDAAIAMRTLWIANAINIVLGGVLVRGVAGIGGVGLIGAAAATVVGRGIGVLYQARQLWRGRGVLRVTRHDLSPDWALLSTLVDLARETVMQSLIATASWTVLVRILSRFGEHVLAGYTVGLRIIVFALLPSWGLASAAATLVGQNLGAGRADRAEKSAWRACQVNIVVLGIFGGLMAIFAEELGAFFAEDPHAIAVAVQCLRSVALGFPLYAFGMVLTQALNGAGDARTPTLINVVCSWVVEIPIAWWITAHTGIGPIGVFWSITTAFSLMALLGAVMFRKGRWKRMRV